nr:hypothetical protein [uncultured Methanoregula sp.]
MSEGIFPGHAEFSFTVPDGGHFEKGRWVTMFTPLLEALADKMDIDTPSFEIRVRADIPIFKQGACIGYDKKEQSLGLFSQRQVLEMLPMSLGAPSSFPEGGDLVQVRR